MKTKTSTQLEAAMVRTAKIILHDRRWKRNRVLFPEQAQVEYPDFDPCRAQQIIAIVTIPAIVNMKNAILSVSFHEDDQVFFPND